MIRKVLRYCKDADYRFGVNSAWGLCDNMPDDEYIKRMFKYTMGYELPLDNPKTYNEKLQWLKLHDRKPIYTTMVDKYAAKEYVSSIIGKEYIIPTLGVWNTFDEIDFDMLPDQFVLKCTHDSGGLVICRDKKAFDINNARKKIMRSLKRNFFYYGREWPYKNVKPRVLAEQYMEDTGLASNPKERNQEIPPLKDYKVYTFNGKARLCMINQDRKIHTRADYFDRDYNWLDFTWGYDHADEKPVKPNNYELMYELAEQLAVGTIELRVDFYEVNNRVFFGELTFFDGSGFDKIEPIEWDYNLGSFLELPRQ